MRRMERGPKARVRELREMAKGGGWIKELIKVFCDGLDILKEWY